MPINESTLEPLLQPESPKLQKLKLHGLDFNGTDVLKVLGRLVQHETLEALELGTFSMLTNYRKPT